MLVAPSPTLPPRVQSLEPTLTIPDRTALVSRRHSTFSPIQASRPLRSSPLAGPSIEVAHDDTHHPGPLSAPPTPRESTKDLAPLTVTPAIADPGGEEDVAAQKRRRRTTFSAVLSKMSFPSSTSSTTPVPPPTSSTSSTSSASSVPDQPAAKPRQRLRSLGAEGTPPVPPMPVWAHDKMSNRRSQILSPSPSLSPFPSSSRSPVLLRPVSVSVPNSPHSSRENLSAATPRPRPRPDHARRSVILPPGPSQGQADVRVSTRLSVAGRLPPSTSRNPEENWLTQASVPKFSRAGLKAQGVVMPVSARAARRASTISMSTAAARARSPGGGPSRPPAAHVAPSVSHGRVPRRPSTAPSLALLTTPIPSGDLRLRTTSLASSTQSRVSAAPSASTSAYFGDQSVSGDGEGDGDADGEGEGRGEGSETPPLTTSSTATSASSLSVSFADPPVSLVSLGADEFGIILPSPESGVQIQLNDIPVHPEAIYSAPHDVKGKGRVKGKERVVAVDVKSVGSAGSISSMASQTYSARSAPSRSESPPGPSGADALWFGSRQPRHARAATAPAEVKAKAKAREGISAEEKENLKRRRSTIARVWKQVVRSVAHR